MKTFAKLALLALAGFGLVACGINVPNPNGGGKGGNNNQNSQKPGWASNVPQPSDYVQPEDPDDGYSEPTSRPEQFPRYDIPEVEIPEEEQPGANELPDTWTGYTPKDPVLTEPNQYPATPELVLKDLVCCTGSYNYDADMLASYGFIVEVSEDVWRGKSITYYGVAADADFVNYANVFLNSSKTPAYLSWKVEPFMSTLQSGEPCVVGYAMTPGEEVYVQFLGYYDDSDAGYEGLYFEFLAAYPEYFQA